MAKPTPRQREIEGRVMHEFKHGELRSGRGGKVKSRRQAIAIAMSESGQSRNRRKSSRGRRKSSRSRSRGRR